MLVPAKGLTTLPGIRRMKGKRRVTYYHIMLERHALLVSEGLATESFYPGAAGMRMLRPHQKLQVFRHFPAVKTSGTRGYGHTVRPCLTYSETRALASVMKSQLAPQKA